MIYAYMKAYKSNLVKIRVILMWKILMKLSQNTHATAAELSINHRSTYCLLKKLSRLRTPKKISLLFLCKGYYQHILSLALVCVRHNGGSRKQNENTNTVWLNQQYMMTSSNGNIFRVTDPLCGEFTGLRWIPRTKASDAELWCFLWSAPNSTAE